MDTLALILSIVGSLNWGLVGIFQFDLVAWLFGGQDSVISRIIYTVIGLAGLWCISLRFRKGQRVEGEKRPAKKRQHFRVLPLVFCFRCRSESLPWASLQRGRCRYRSRRQQWRKQ